MRIFESSARYVRGLGNVKPGVYASEISKTKSQQILEIFSWITSAQYPQYFIIAQCYQVEYIAILIEEWLHTSIFCLFVVLFVVSYVWLLALSFAISALMPRSAFFFSPCFHSSYYSSSVNSFFYVSLSLHSSG